MSFEHAPVTKACMVFLALTSLLVGIFDVKHYFHLQLVPHISKHHQYWRIFLHHFACTNSSDLFLIELLLYNVAIPIERAYGSMKYGSFALLATAINSLTTFVTMLIIQAVPRLGQIFNYIPAGPTALVFSIIYQYLRLVPQAYQFKIFGIGMSDKIWFYVLAFQLAISQLPASMVPTAVGLLTGALYRSDFLQLKGWRLSHRLARLLQTWIGPVLGDNRQIRRTNRVLPERRSAASVLQALLGVDEPITTARTPSPSAQGTRITPTDTSQEPHARRTVEHSPSEQSPGGQADVLRQWMSELRGATVPNVARQGNVRVPDSTEITLLTGMFPEMDREVVLGVLQRSPNLETATETLLSSQR
ncbi:hypothetical protein K474DRAFT_1611586 [Panus rudis PR-1116 ss-1]|nr:hypothetical protein K474DRAFT_1611586 [Panus rudis PR-1116 ss-1]